MHPLVYLMLIATGSCLAHYRPGYDTRNYIERDEPLSDVEGDLVECPVCENRGSLVSTHEECPIVRGSKRYKKCSFGMYLNEMCGGRVDCFRGPGERCTEKMDFDYYDQRCARGYYCNKNAHVCTGIGYDLDSNLQYFLNPDHRYHNMRDRREA